jgi:hypothetical protein
VEVGLSEVSTAGTRRVVLLGCDVRCVLFGGRLD